MRKQGNEGYFQIFGLHSAVDADAIYLDGGKLGGENGTQACGEKVFQELCFRRDEQDTTTSRPRGNVK